MKTLAIAIIAGLAGGVLSQQYGDMPTWAQSMRLYHAAEIGDADYLAEVLGCTLQEPQAPGRSMQCGETFLWVSPAGSTRLALGVISNVQVEGEVWEARAFTSTVGTRGAGRVHDGVLFDGQCYGDLDNCVILQGQGWGLRVVENRLELVDPGGVVRQSWLNKAEGRRAR